MITGALWLLDHVPARMRRRLVVTLAAFAVGALIALLAIAPSPAPAGKSRAGAHSGVTQPARPSTIAPRVGASPTQPGPVHAPAVAVAARRFLSGYLAYAYRAAPAQAIPDAAPGLRRALATAQASTPPAAALRRPTVISLQVTLAGASNATAVASIADGGSVSYPLTLQLHAGAGGWQVISLGDD